MSATPADNIQSSTWDDVPDIISAAGDDAVRAYREFLDDPKWKASTRRQYQKYVGRFLRWAAGRGLTVESIGRDEIVAYSATVAAEMAPNTVSVYLSAISAAFRHLASTGVIATNPCELPLSISEVRTTDQNEGPEDAFERKSERGAGFPLLDLLAMLGEIEAETLRRVFDEEEIALSLLEHVRWIDGQKCPHCGAAGGDDPPAQAVCQVCAKPYSVTTGTFFDGTHIPLRFWFVVIHQLYFADSVLSDDDLRRRFGFHLPVLLFLCRRIGEVMAQEGLPLGDELKRAIAVRNKELMQDDVGRAIIKYGEMEALRNRLVQARDEGTSIDDLPEGMTLEMAIEKVEAWIAVEDTYEITLKDGYLMRSQVSPDEIAGSAPEAKSDRA